MESNFVFLGGKWDLLNYFWGFFFFFLSFLVICDFVSTLTEKLKSHPKYPATFYEVDRSCDCGVDSVRDCVLNK